jgi:hypothetical protein
MAIEERIPLLEDILDKWKNDLGNDYLGYKNHVYRMIHFCFALHPCNNEAESAAIYEVVTRCRIRSGPGDKVDPWEAVTSIVPASSGQRVKS